MLYFGKHSFLFLFTHLILILAFDRLGLGRLYIVWIWCLALVCTYMAMRVLLWLGRFIEPYMGYPAVWVLIVISVVAIPLVISNRDLIILAEASLGILFSLNYKKLSSLMPASPSSASCRRFRRLSMTKLNYKLISTYRTQLMGLAILWVVLYHSTINASSVPVLGTLQAYGYGGVDIFLLVSGLGLYYAYRGNVSMATFYKRRLQRILPTYLPVVLLFCLLYWGIGEMSFTEVLLNLTTLSFWLGLDSRFDWYVPALLVLYFLTPLFMYFSGSGIR